MAENNAVVGVYNTHTEAEASIKKLQRSGFDMKKLSIVGKDYHTEEHVVGYYNAGDPPFGRLPPIRLRQTDGEIRESYSAHGDHTVIMICLQNC
jgi:hypothetical protein